MLKQIRYLWIEYRNSDRKDARRRRWFVAALTAIAVAMLFWWPAAAYPPVGTDEFDSAAIITVDLTSSGGPVLNATVVGPTRIERSAPFDPGDGHLEINTEIVALELRAMDPFMNPITVRESPTKRSIGKIKQKTAGTDFPADSFFDVFVEIDALGMVFHNNAPIRLETEINEIPPFHAEYIPPTTFVGVDLFDASGNKVGVITHASHFVGQKPSLSVAPAGPSGLNPASIFDVPVTATPPISATNLGLGAGDDLDALSYGLDYIAPFIPPFPSIMDIRFSVDPLAVGAAGAVVVEAGAGEAHGDEFRVSPMLPGGSNAQVLDENGSTAPPLPLLISDDVDALTEPPTSFVDYDGDGIPNFPVYFSLAQGSPTLGTIPGAGPADILMTMGGASPTIFIPGTTLLGTVQAGDDVDALCLDATTTPPTVLFSLAPGSPSLVGLGGPADLFLPGPILFAPASVLGLLPTDNLNALKCTLPEVDFFPDSTAQITLAMGPITETITLSGPTIVYVAIGPDGVAEDAGTNGLEEVQTELVHLELTGDSSLGTVTVRLRDPSQDPFHPSVGVIEETTDNTSGVLDLPPFTTTGTADSVFDVYFEVEVDGVGVLHTHNPKRMQTTITHKPPARGETYKNSDAVELYDESDQPTGIQITEAFHTPNSLASVFLSIILKNH